MQNFIQEGKFLDYTNGTGSPIVSGQLVVLSAAFVAIATGDIADGETGTVATSGVYEVALLNTDEPVVGAKLYWDVSEGHLTTTATDNIFAGWAVENITAGATTVKVMIDRA